MQRFNARLPFIVSFVCVLIFAGAVVASPDYSPFRDAVPFAPGAASSDLIPAADNTYDIGSTSLGWKDLNLSAGGALKYSGRSQVTSPADGDLLLRDAAGTSFGLLQFGGTTSSFPALARDVAGLSARLADNSGMADVRARAINLRSDVSGANGLVMDGGASVAGVRMRDILALQWTGSNNGGGAPDTSIRRGGAGIVRFSDGGSAGPSAIEMQEWGTAPAAPAANGVRIYAREEGGKTALFARFNTGAEVQIAIEP